MSAGHGNSEFMSIQKLSEYLEMKASTLYS